MDNEKFEASIRLAQMGKTMEDVIIKTLELIDGTREEDLVDYVKKNLSGFGMILQVIQEKRPRIWKKLSL